MQTSFTPEQLANPQIAHSEGILRRCVHCGFCTATCPTYVELGNELDSPRGRIYMIKEMLERGRPADRETVTHIDRCLSCLSCVTTCPSGVNYMHLIVHARVYVEKTYRRPLLDRSLRALLAKVLPYPQRFRFALKLAKLGRPLALLFRRLPGLKPLAAMLELAPTQIPPASRPAPASPVGARRGRVALLSGCAQSVLAPEINAATSRLLGRLGIETIQPEAETCCGALVHHMGREEEALAFARNNIDVWSRAIEEQGLDAIVITASGCGTTIKDYAHMLRLDPLYAEKAKRISSLTKDITEYLVDFEFPEPTIEAGMEIAYHAACSLQHGQKITREPGALLANAGFIVNLPREGHLCCGSAGTYNILQPEISKRLLARKVTNIEATGAVAVATGNIGCITQISTATDLPIVHTVELLDWAYGGPKPQALSVLSESASSREPPEFPST